MNDATQYYLDRLRNQLSSECLSAQSRIRTATTMRAVKFAATVHANAIIRSLPQVRQDLSRVHDSAEKQMETLLGQQLRVLENCRSSEQLRQEHVRLVRSEWIFLRGDFARIYVYADRQYNRLLQQHVQREGAHSAAPAYIEPGSDDQDHCAPAP